MRPQVHAFACLRLVARKKLSMPIGLHYGVHVAQVHLGLRNLVVDLSAGGSSSRSPAAFLAGHEWAEIEDPFPDDNRAAMQRLQVKLDQQDDYGLLANNCEDWARSVNHGKKRSTQRDAVVLTFCMWAVFSLGSK